MKQFNNDMKGRCFTFENCRVVLRKQAEYIEKSNEFIGVQKISSVNKE